MGNPEPLIDLRPDHLATVRKILRQFLPNATVWAYGSRVSWTDEEYSDLDLVARNLPDPMSPLGGGAIEEAREEFIHSALPFRVELFDWACLPEKFHTRIAEQYAVLQEGKPGAGSEEGENPDWRETTLGEIAEIITNSKVNINEITLQQYVSTDNMLPNKGGIVSAEKFPSGEKANAFLKTDTLLSNIRTYFRKVWFAAFNGAASADVLIFRAKNNQTLNPLFLYYLIAGEEFIAYSVLTSKGAKMPRGDKEAIKKYPLLLPPLPEQRAIAAVLGSLDDKIALNQKINRTLEATARALFKSWFVDFDPVKAKMAGKAPFGMDAETAALFPDKLVESELGEIPEGWGVSSLDNIVSVTKGKSYKSEELQSSDTALVTLKSFGRGGGYRLDGLKPYIGSYKPEQEIKPGEIVVAFTDVTQAAEVIGRAALVIRDDRYNKLVASLDTAVIRPINPDLYSNAFLYFLMGQPLFVDHMLSYTSGTTVLHLSKDAIPSYKTTLPTQKISEAFSKIAEPLMQKIAITSEENKTIERTRDYLLPKLLSGEIRIKDAEKLIEEKS